MSSDPNGRLPGPFSLIDRGIERMFGGYQHPMNQVDPTLPREHREDRRVAVIGGGLAGLCPAVTLAERGFGVDLYEKESYLGGKLGSWPVTFEDGSTRMVEHGFHAFFRHYYNLNAFLEKLGLTRSFRSIGDYLILAEDGRRFSFQGIKTTPVVNLFSLMHKKAYTLGDVLRDPRTMRLAAMLQYHPEKTFRRFDHMSYQDWARSVALPPRLKLMFNTFSRAFFASPRDMSTAELIKSFHFFFLSHDGGLIYEYPTDDYEITLLAPVRKHLEEHGARIHLGRPVEAIEPDGNKFRVHGEEYDHLILASDVVGTRTILERSTGLTGQHPLLASVARNLHASKGYAVLRFSADRDTGLGMPGFIITEKKDFLDSVSFYHRLEESSREWSQKNGRFVFELHCYALPDREADKKQVRDGFLEEFFHYFPDMQGCKISDEHLQLRQDFSAFHTGMYQGRPTHLSGVPNLYLAGDWVKLPRPAMLMEAACTSGMLSANEIFKRSGLQTEPLFSVPPRGILSSG